MTPMITDTWRRAWTDGVSRLTVELDPGGRVFVAVDSCGLTGFAASFNASATAEIAAFITAPGASTDREWRDGLSRLVIVHDPDGHVRFAVHDTETFGYTASFTRVISHEIAAFIDGDITT